MCFNHVRNHCRALSVIWNRTTFLASSLRWTACPQLRSSWTWHGCRSGTSIPWLLRDQRDRRFRTQFHWRQAVYPLIISDNCVFLRNLIRSSSFFFVLFKFLFDLCPLVYLGRDSWCWQSAEASNSARPFPTTLNLVSVSPDKVADTLVSDDMAMGDKALPPICFFHWHFSLQGSMLLHIVFICSLFSWEQLLLIACVLAWLFSFSISDTRGTRRKDSETRSATAQVQVLWCTAYVLSVQVRTSTLSIFVHLCPMSQVESVGNIRQPKQQRCSRQQK